MEDLIHKLWAENELVKCMILPSCSYNEVGSSYSACESMCHLATELCGVGGDGGGGGGGDVWSLLCKMEMSLPRFAVAKLFWNGSHRKTLGRAGKLGHLQEQGSAFFRGETVATRAKTKEIKRVLLFIQGREYTDLSIKNKTWGLNAVKVKKLFNRDLRMT